MDSVGRISSGFDFRLDRHQLGECHGAPVGVFPDVLLIKTHSQIRVLAQQFVGVKPKLGIPGSVHDVVRSEMMLEDQHAARP